MEKRVRRRILITLEIFVGDIDRITTERRKVKVVKLSRTTNIASIYYYRIGETR